MTPVPMPSVEVVDLRRSFRGVEALAGVTFSVPRGEVFALLGPNGAGKSTLVRILCGLQRPTGGRAHVAGFDVVRASTDVRRRIGVALQDVGLDELQTGWSFLRTQARLQHLRGRRARQRVADVAELSGLGDALSRSIGAYSGGMKRRLDLAAALVGEPEVLFLDEPTTGLDPISRQRVWEEVAALHRDAGTTVLLTTQYLEEADALAERIAILRDGRIAAEGTPAELKRSVAADVITVRLAAGDATMVAELLGSMPGVVGVTGAGDRCEVSVIDAPSAMLPLTRALDGAGAAVAGIDVRTTTLDDVFRHVTHAGGVAP